MTIHTITLGGGCFWCIEAVFEQLTGVEKVVSGYCGGPGAAPTYEQVCTGRTGHAEVAVNGNDRDTLPGGPEFDGGELGLGAEVLLLGGHADVCNGLGSVSNGTGLLGFGLGHATLGVRHGPLRPAT